MTTKWKKQNIESKSESTNIKRKEEDSRGAPIELLNDIYEKKIPDWFEILKNYKNKDIDTEGFTDKDKTDIREPFDIFIDDTNYYKNCENYLKKILSPNFTSLLKYLIDYILCPLRKTDVIIENTIADLLKIFIALKDCSKDISGNKVVQTIDLSPVVDPDILWTDMDDPLEGFHTQNIKEGFSKNTKGSEKISIFIESFLQNHPSLRKFSEQLEKYYITSVNETETKLEKYMTEKQLFDFNNRFDESLNDPIVVNQIKKLAVEKKTSTPPPIPIPTPTTTPKLNPCEQTQKDALDELRKYSKTIKNEVYNILIVPLVLYVTYNIYYVFFFKKPVGDQCEYIKFEDCEKIFEEYSRNYFQFFIEFIFKPTSCIYHTLNEVKTWFIGLNAFMPYVFFFLIFSLLYVFGINNYTWFMSTIYGLFLFKTPAVLQMYATIITIIFFGKSIFAHYNNIWAPYLRKRPWSGMLLFILYWVFKFLVSWMLIPFSVTILIFYFLTYSVLGIFLNHYEVFGQIDQMNDFIYTSLYTPENDSALIILLQSISKYFFIYLFELILIIILINGLSTYFGNIHNQDLKTFLLIINVSIIIITSIWCIIKYKMTVIQVLNILYDPINGKKYNTYDCADKSIKDEGKTNIFDNVYTFFKDITSSNEKPEENNKI